MSADVRDGLRLAIQLLDRDVRRHEYDAGHAAAEQAPEHDAIQGAIFGLVDLRRKLVAALSEAERSAKGAA